VKKVFCSNSIFPSYLGHMLGLSEICHDDEYTKKYSKYVADPDIAWLNHNRELFQWGNGLAGPLFGYCLLISGYVNPSDKIGIKKYYESLLLLGENANASHLVKAFPELNSYQSNWAKLDHPQAIEMLHHYKSRITEFMDILLQNWNPFQRNVWPLERKQILQAAEVINSRLSSFDLIEKWEWATGLKFQCNQYEFVLSSGMRKAPRFNSLGYDKNWVHFDTPLLFESIIHEIGTHLLRPIKQSIKGDFDYLHVYNSYETLCCVLTEKIFVTLDLKSSILKDSKVFDSDAYDFYTEQIITLPALDLSELLLEYLDSQRSKQSQNEPLHQPVTTITE